MGLRANFCRWDSRQNSAHGTPAQILEKGLLPGFLDGTPGRNLIKVLWGKFWNGTPGQSPGVGLPVGISKRYSWLNSSMGLRQKSEQRDSLPVLIQLLYGQLSRAGAGCDQREIQCPLLSCDYAQTNAYSSSRRRSANRNAGQSTEPQTQVEAEPPTGPAEPSLVAEALELKRSWESKKDAAIQELLAKRTAIEKEFNETLKEIESHLTDLGYTREPEWVPVPASKVQPFRKAKRKSKSAGEMICPICTTDPENPVLGHDG